MADPLTAWERRRLAASRLVGDLAALWPIFGGDPADWPREKARLRFVLSQGMAGGVCGATRRWPDKFGTIRRVCGEQEEDDLWITDSAG